MKTLILLRHAEALPDTPGNRDFNRQLTESGLNIARKTAVLMREHGLVPDRIVASSAVRTMQTAEQIAETICPDAGILAVDELYLAPSTVYSEVAAEHGQSVDSVVLIVGHNPGIANLMCIWSQIRLSVPPATLAAFEVDLADWSEVSLDSRNVMRLKYLFQDAAPAAF